MEIKRRNVLVALVASVLLLSTLRSFEAMAFPTAMKVILHVMLISTWAKVWTTAQVALPCSSSTAINGTPFPSLIDVTTEDLIGGLESGLFTSVDLVNAYIARIMEVGPNSCPSRLITRRLFNTTPHHLHVLSWYPSGQLHAARGQRTQSRCVEHRPEP